MHPRLSSIYHHVATMDQRGYNKGRLAAGKGDTLLLNLIQVHHLVLKDASLIGKFFQHEQVLLHRDGIQIPVILQYSMEPHPADLLLHSIALSWNGCTRVFEIEDGIPEATELMDKLLAMDFDLTTAKRVGFYHPAE